MILPGINRKVSLSSDIDSTAVGGDDSIPREHVDYQY
jgi:hypothetical protein